MAATDWPALRFHLSALHDFRRPTVFVLPEHGRTETITPYTLEGDVPFKQVPGFRRDPSDKILASDSRMYERSHVGSHGFPNQTNADCSRL